MFEKWTAWHNQSFHILHLLILLYLSHYETTLFATNNCLNSHFYQRIIEAIYIAGEDLNTERFAKTKRYIYDMIEYIIMNGGFLYGNEVLPLSNVWTNRCDC